MIATFRNKVIVVTGGTGAVGSELVHQLLKFKPKQVRVLSRDDTKQYYLREELNHPKNLRLFIGDVRDKDRLLLAFDGADYVFHAAALKHVPIGEYNPFELVKTNIVGSQNVIEAALEKGVKKVIGISTDKAVNPANVMGATKLMMEKLFINANFYKGDASTVFSCVRFGNVAWARGSVLPLWQKQAAATRAIRITDRNMTRFFMSMEQAVRLVLKATALSQFGEIFVLKMPSIRLGSLADMFAEKYNHGRKLRVKVIGNRGSEKMHEGLLDDNDLGKEIFESEEMFVVTPSAPIYNLELPKVRYAGFSRLKSPRRYTSAESINEEEVAKLI